MAGNRKIVNEQEVIRWYQEGKTYQWMVEEYERKYGIQIRASAFSSLRRKYGLERRIVRNDDLIPWHIEPKHRWAYPVIMLRAEARRRAGKELKRDEARRLESWLARMERDDTVLHYDPDTEEGWFYVPRRPGIDKDIIRVPPRKTTSRKAAD